jgi:non-specific serine/threonine protein kinase
VQRRQTLGAAIDWSYELCSPAERRPLARLAVFAGGCTREAVEAVCGTDPLCGGEMFVTKKQGLIGEKVEWAA